MKKIIFVLSIIALFQAAGVSHAAEALTTIASAKGMSTSPAVVPGDSFTDQKSGMEFVHVKGGCYCMGAATGEGTPDAVPTHEVCVDDYYIGKYEVTQAQWRAIMGSNPSMANACGDNCPVVGVSFNEVQEFARRVSKQTGKEFRLPTEAEWEYAARNGGSQYKTGAANDSAHVLHPVGWSQANALGIYDMQGSVWEWTSDKYSKSYYRTSPKNNPEGPAEGRYRVLRGGSWIDNDRAIQPTFRIKYEPSIKRQWVGLRLLSPDQYSAKRYLPESLSSNVSAEQDCKCRTVQEASVR